MAKLQPLGDYVIIKQLAAEEMTKSGFYIPDSAKEKPNKGEVVAVGPGGVVGDNKVIEMHVSVGDIVYYKKYAGDNFKMEGEELIVLRQDGIIAKEV
ncbi:MAG: co-chaperone GroES [Candidatus Gracilibacteria bacterium]